MKRNREITHKLFTLAAVTVFYAFFAVICTGCGGGGGAELPIPRSLKKDCSDSPYVFQTLNRASGRYADSSIVSPEEAATTIQCIQLFTSSEDYEAIPADYTMVDLFPKSVSATAGDELYVWAVLYDYSCNIVTPADDFSWSIDSSIGEIMTTNTYSEVEWPYSSSYPLESSDVYINSSESTISGNINVQYKGFSDAITITATPGETQGTMGGYTRTTGREE